MGIDVQDAAARSAARYFVWMSIAVIIKVTLLSDGE
jgi:hypothetical protein